jgi:hypothetical protein
VKRRVLHDDHARLALSLHLLRQGVQIVLDLCKTTTQEPSLKEYSNRCSASPSKHSSVPPMRLMRP